MVNLESSNVKLKGQPANKAEAIRTVGQLLVDSGYIKAGYIDSMMGREKVANTYLGNGISIPHGLPKDRELILKTGIAVVQVPAGVEWNSGEKVHLVVGIAAKSDEHLQVLTNLTHVLGDVETVRWLAQTEDAGDIIGELTGDRDQKKAAQKPTETLADFPKFVDVTVSGPHGLHARPATMFVDLAKEFDAVVHVRLGDKVANGKSLVSLLNLGADSGSTIRIMVQGQDEDDALGTLRDAVESGLGEDEEEDTVEIVAHGWTPQEVSLTIPGISASPGLAIGPVRQFKHQKIVVERCAKDPLAEELKLEKAIAGAQVELEELHHEVKKRSGAKHAAIFRAHAEFLNDPDLIQDTIDLMKTEEFTAGYAWQEAIKERVTAMEKLDDPVLAGRAVDLSDVGNRVLKLLAGVIDDTPFVPDAPVILIADDLTPSDTANLDPAYILGFCTAGGGPTSHSAIIARSLGIPAMVAAGPAVLHQTDGTIGILDGDTGNLYLEPSDADIESAKQAEAAMAEIRDAEFQARYEPALTTDGHRVEVVANINRAAEAEQAVNAGGEGVGLLRTEFLFLERNDPPSEDEQYEAYTTMVKALGGLPLIIRTLDIGGDKNVPYLNLPAEDNSFLGVRGIRLCLHKPELFKPQLRAIFRAAQHGPIKIMFPMISTLEDLVEAKAIVEEVRQEVEAEPVEIGIMIEVPSAVVLAPELAQKVDFFSIGTNDLTQYTLAMDRLHPMLAKKADGLHPAVLRMIDKTVQAATAAGKWVGVCGGVAGDPTGAVILVGLGVTELSVSIPSIAAVKAKMRKISAADAKEVAEKALKCRNAAEVRALSV